jgi:AraC-like DNA-binding protein
MYVRTFYGIGVSYSFDRGQTWTLGEDTGWGGPNSRFYIGKLKSGRTLLINHVNYSGRNNLTALLSEDEGKTWKYSLLLDGRSEVSYPDVKEDEKGNIYVIYDRERGGFKSTLSEAYGCAREILYAKITEADIMAGKLVGEESKLKTVVSKLGVYAKERENPFAEINRFSNEELASYLMQEEDRAIERLFDVYRGGCEGAKEGNYQKIDALVEQFNDKDRREEALLELIVLLRRQNQKGAERFPIVEVIKQEILNTWGQDFSVKKLAKKVKVSEYYMMHLFKKCTGTTILEYRDGLRISKAKELLVRTEKSVVDIAQECGFDNVSYFSEFFKKREEVSPTEYRSLLKK